MSVSVSVSLNHTAFVVSVSELLPEREDRLYSEGVGESSRITAICVVVSGSRSADSMSSAHRPLQGH